MSNGLLTLADTIGRFGVDVDEHHDRDGLVPVNTGVQRQGDVIVIPATRDAQTPVPREGVPVVRGEAGGNTHLLLADGPVRFDFDTQADRDPMHLRLGALTVPEGSVAYLAHPEHAYAGIGSGTYEVRRQREQADVIRRVAD